MIIKKYPRLQDDWFCCYLGKGGISMYMWGKLYKASLLRESELKPSGYRLREDWIFNMHLFPNVKTWVVTSYHGYHYRWGGMTARFNPFWPEMRDQNMYLREFAKTHGRYEENKKYLDKDLVDSFLHDVAHRKDYMTPVEYDQWLEDALNEDVWNLTKSEGEKPSRILTLIYSKDLDGIKAYVKPKSFRDKLIRVGQKALKKFAGF